MDIQQSLLEKEATRYALLSGEEGNLEVVRTSWEVCTYFIKGFIEASNYETKEDILFALEALLGRTID